MAALEPNSNTIYARQGLASMSHSLASQSCHDFVGALDKTRSDGLVYGLHMFRLEFNRHGAIALSRYMNTIPHRPKEVNTLQACRILQVLRGQRASRETKKMVGRALP